MGINRELVEMLVCPRCQGDLGLLPADLRQTEEEETEIVGCMGLLCEKCDVVYPVIDDIPVMLIEEAVPRSAWQDGKDAEKP